MSALVSPIASSAAPARSGAGPLSRFAHALVEIGAIFVASTRCAAAVEAGRAPASSDLELLGITDHSAFRHAIGR